MTDLTKLKELAELSAQWSSTIGCQDWYSPAMFKQPEFGEADSAYIAAVNPQAILGLIERLEKAEQHWANENSNNIALIAEVERLRSALLEVRDAFADVDATCFAATIGAIDAALEGGGR